jgi:transcriptional regulator with XRE-family HTH domain
LPTKHEVGQRVRLARFKRDMTLKEVAARAGMSATHISEIERGRTSPTIGALQKIAKALDERPSRFVEERPQRSAVLVKRDQRERMFSCDCDGCTISFQKLTGDGPWATAQVMKLVASAGEKCNQPATPGEMVILCTDGMLRVTVGDESHVLRDGDTIHFPTENGYTTENIGDDKAALLAISAMDSRISW